MPYGKTNGKPAGMADPKTKKKGSPSAKVNMPATPGKSTGKMVNMPNKLGQTKGVKKRNVSAMGSKDPIGPQTKREAKKAAPMVPYSQSTSSDVKKAKRKATIAKVGAAIGTAAGIVVSEVRARQKSRGLAKFNNSNDPRLGTDQKPSNKELRQMGRAGKKKTK